MRTLDLLKALSDTELKMVERSLSGGKRETLLKLFKELKKYIPKEEEPSHEVLFEKLMGEAYSKDKDYLLRNKMRQLNEIIYEFLATDAFKNSIASNPSAYNFWLMRAYYDRRVKSLFESDIDSFLTEAIGDISKSPSSIPNYSLYLYSLKGLWTIGNQARVPANIETQLALLDEWTHEVKRRFLHNIREIEARQAFLKMQLKLMKNEFASAVDAKEGLSSIDLSRIEEGDWFARHLVLKKLAYLTAGWDRVKVLEEMLQLHDVAKYAAALGSNDKITNMTNLATELIVLGEYQAGDDYLIQLIALCKQLGQPVLIAVIQNHMVNQINLARYEKGLQIHKEFNKEIAGSRSAKGIALQSCYFYLFLDKEDQALSKLPESTTLTKQHQVHHRYVYLIAFILRGDHSLALTETANLKRMIKKTDEVDIELHLSILNFFEKYIKALSNTKREKEQAMTLLRHKIEVQYKKWDLIASKELPLRWLMTKLQIARLA